jgi:hypothetical protein
MRTLVPVLLFALAFGACQCGPDVPTPVTFRIKNPGQSPVYVDATDGRMGMKVKRRIGGEWLPFVEEPACPCLSCDLVCGGCDCAEGAPSPRVMKVVPGGSFERVWAGQVQVSGHGSCGSSIIQGPACLRGENPPIDETFRLEFCYSPSATGAEHQDGGVVVPGSLPAESVLCLERPFQVREGVVEVSPERGADCQSHGECQGEGELCFGGGCTRACPETGFPELGGGWLVRIPEPDDMGFFTWEKKDGVATYTGVGTVGSVRYENDTMTLALRRALQGGGNALGTLYVTLPRGVAAPFTIDEPVSVTVVDASTNANPDNRGVVVRDGQGVLLLAADTAQKGPVLRAQELGSLSVSRSPDLVGCRHTACGKRLHHRTHFSLGAEALALDPGATADLSTAGQTFRLAAVGNARYETTHCTLDDVMPWAVVNLRPDGAGP